MQMWLYQEYHSCLEPLIPSLHCSFKSYRFSSMFSRCCRREVEKLVIAQYFKTFLVDTKKNFYCLGSKNISDKTRTALKVADTLAFGHIIWFVPLNTQEDLGVRLEQTFKSKWWKANKTAKYVAYLSSPGN